MGKAIPTLGYPSRTAAAVALREQGLKYDEIAVRMEVSTSAVSGLLSSAASRGNRAARTIVVPVEILEQLSPHAVLRGIRVNDLVRKILRCITDDNMTDAVLDDADELTERN